MLATLTRTPTNCRADRSRVESDASVDLFALYDVSDAPRFVTYVFQRTVAPRTLDIAESPPDRILTQRPRQAKVLPET